MTEHDRSSWADMAERRLERFCWSPDLPYDEFVEECGQLFSFAEIPGRYASFFTGLLNGRREDPPAGHAEFVRGVAELLARDFAGALRAFEAVAAKEEGETDAEIAMGLVHLIAGDTAAAAEVLSGASEWDAKQESGDFALQLLASWALLAAGRPHEALRAADWALELDLTSADALAAKAEALYALGDRELAARFLRSAIYHDPTLESARGRLLEIAEPPSLKGWRPSAGVLSALDELARSFRRTGGLTVDEVDVVVAEMISRLARYVDARDLDPRLAATHLDTILFSEVRADLLEEPESEIGE